MASLADVHAALVVQTQAINDLAARIPGPPAATEADLENVKKDIEANTALVVNMPIPGPGGPNVMSAKATETKTSSQSQPPQQPRDRDRNR